MIVATHRPVAREEWPTKIFGTTGGKWEAVTAEVRELVAAGRPVLIGTRSIDKSETLSDYLTRSGVEHQVLNARHVRHEAAIVAEAGKRARVTVATNMAGRGTDIKLDDAVRAAGGLHVIGTELHDARRIDRQLVGRCGRQGDRGSFRQFLSMEDEIFRTAWSPERAKRIAAAGRESDGSFDRYLPMFLRAQRRVERRMSKHRRAMLHQERERKKTYDRVGFDYYLDCPD